MTTKIAIEIFNPSIFGFMVLSLYVIHLCVTNLYKTKLSILHMKILNLHTIFYLRIILIANLTKPKTNILIDLVNQQMNQYIQTLIYTQLLYILCYIPIIMTFDYFDIEAAYSLFKPMRTIFLLFMGFAYFEFVILLLFTYIIYKLFIIELFYKLVFITSKKIEIST